MVRFKGNENKELAENCSKLPIVAINYLAQRNLNTWGVLHSVLGSRFLTPS